MKIWIFNDDGDVEKGLASVLDRAGHVPIAMKKPKTEEQLEFARPDAAIFELSHPNESGLRLLTKRMPRLPVIILSDFADTAMAGRPDWKPAAVLINPLNVGALLKKLNDIQLSRRTRLYSAREKVRTVLKRNAN